MAGIVLKDVVKRYGSVEAVNNVNLSIDSGEFVVFVGPSGCGKSTLLRMISGLEEITEGEIYIDNKMVNHIDPAGRGIAMVFQSYALYPHMTVAKNMGFGLRMNGRPKEEVKKRVLAAAKTLQIENLLDRMPKQLSGGQRQRVAIGRAIVRDPKVFLFDEPLSNLDAELRVEMRLQIAKLHQELGNTMIYVTHDQVEAMTLADKIVVLNKGNIEHFGTPMELYHRPQNLFVAGFIGSPKMNLIPGEVSAIEDRKIHFNINRTETLTIERQISGLQPGRKITMGIRPEHLNIENTDDVRLTMRNEATERLGNITYLFGTYAGIGNFKVSMPVDSNPKLHKNIELSCQSRHIHLFDEYGQRISCTS
ncbi:MAG: sn-glycerol-3-phosphate ABC transporter ATP-binding protein UgpC [Desulfobacteraceae bacterium]|jgi:multiple sugar transport system ATP-binding protein/lactose/L-arabinose transport system ATP-binding protein